MTQEERWLRKYEEVVALVDEQMTLEDEDVFWRFCVLKVEKDLSGIKIASKKRGNFDTELKIIRIFAAQKHCE